MPGRAAKQSPVPAALHDQLQSWLRSGHPDGLYSHQAAAIEACLGGAHVCLATATASGKSLVFMSIAADILLRDPNARVLALYPARALIQDQLAKWNALANPLGLRVAHIDGGVAVDQRVALLDSAHVVLMTPDVAHAWLMNQLSNPAVRRFLDRVRLLVADEAHVYEGAFGTNMAYLLRRMSAAMGPHRFVSSTATLGQPSAFIEQLTGLTVTTYGPADDGSPMSDKPVLLVNAVTGSAFDAAVHLLNLLSDSAIGRFLAFTDSRKAVEQFVAACYRGPHEAAAAEPEDEPENERRPANLGEDTGDAPTLTSPGQRILPYRAGYETADRKAIQEALSRGELSGVVATSALELGLDIGEIDIVLLLDVPTSMKAFWQRIGRAGRRRPSVCLMFDPRGKLHKLGLDLAEYMHKPIEPNWLYLQNRYIQYAHVLCAAIEMTAFGSRSSSAAASFLTLPPKFVNLLNNELTPNEPVPADLYPLKQRGQNDPHHEFGLRGSVEQSFQIQSGWRRLGEATLAQALREAYPGAIYYYLSRPYRVIRWHHGNGTISAQRSPSYTTSPTTQTMVFPGFDRQMFSYLSSSQGFLAEVEVQVSERVLGFTERRGRNRTSYAYGPGSPYSQRELRRFFETTGVCWYFDDRAGMSEAVVERLLQVFSGEYGVQERDLGHGLFHTNSGPGARGRIQGVCIYDATEGSLRLTQLLADNFATVVDGALTAFDDLSNEEAEELGILQQRVRDLAPSALPTDSALGQVGSEDWRVVVAPGEKAMCHLADRVEEVTVLDCQYTPSGVVYLLQHPDPSITKWRVPAGQIQPIYGTTRLQRRNFVTDEVEPVGVASQGQG